MTIYTRSSFYYGITIDDNNNKIDFNEGGSDLVATIEIGKYSLTDFAQAVAVQMTAEGTQLYIVTVDRSTRLLTISSTSNFSLLVTTGINAGIGAWGYVGFSVDQTGSNTYTGTIACGSSYKPQFLLQNYVAFEDYSEATDGVVNKAASGKVSVVSFGSQRFMECLITWVTDRPQQFGSIIENDASAISNLRNFLIYAITKGDLEFIPDRATPSTYTRCVLESTPSSKDGIGFKLQELYGKGCVGYFETGLIKFRER